MEKPYTPLDGMHDDLSTPSKGFVHRFAPAAVQPGPKVVIHVRMPGGVGLPAFLQRISVRTELHGQAGFIGVTCVAHVMAVVPVSFWAGLRIKRF
jgi:hypothetical protein